ncbi:hypothetical protein M885DRAFT_2128 [Pelagophyceae sp. CCMP2097]|nr:hypothetical protein M885DRAFT_2128 [Pelagophyceae sp. CCMP2097]
MAGISHKSSRADQLLLGLIRTRGLRADSADGSDSPPPRELHIFDCRGRAAAVANRAAGKGTESVGDYDHCTLSFGDMGAPFALFVSCAFLGESRRRGHVQQGHLAVVWGLSAALRADARGPREPCSSGLWRRRGTMPEDGSQDDSRGAPLMRGCGDGAPKRTWP